MTTDARVPKHSPRPDEQAREWIVRLKSGNPTVDDLAAFRIWRSAAAENETAYREALGLWEFLGPALREAAPSRGAAQAARPRWSRRQLLGGAVAAGAVAVALPLSFALPFDPAGAVVLETAKGERRSETFPDGTVVDLNTDTRVVSWMSEDDGSRHLRLDRGEILLAVAFGPERRLLASASDVEVRAQQARFLMRYVGSRPDIACVSGAIEVSRDGGTVTLAASQNLASDAGVPAPGAVANPDAALDWRRGVYVFENCRAGDVVAELNRYRPGRVLLAGWHADTPISGVIHLDNVDAAVDHVARSLGLSVQRLPGGFAVIG